MCQDHLENSTNRIITDGRCQIYHIYKVRVNELVWFQFGTIFHAPKYDLKFAFSLCFYSSINYILQIRPQRQKASNNNLYNQPMYFLGTEQHVKTSLRCDNIHILAFISDQVH